MAISIQQFQSLANGRYNAGELVLDKAGKLNIANNHVTMRFLNKTKVEAADILAVKNEFIATLNENGISKGKIDKIRMKLGLPKSPDDRVDMTKLKPLTRAEVREILDKYANDINDKNKATVISNRHADADAGETEKYREIARIVNMETYQPRWEANLKAATELEKKGFNFPIEISMFVNEKQLIAHLANALRENPGTMSPEEIKISATKTYLIDIATKNGKEHNLPAVTTAFSQVKDNSSVEGFLKEFCSMDPVIVSNIGKNPSESTKDELIAKWTKLLPSLREKGLSEETIEQTLWQVGLQFSENGSITAIEQEENEDDAWDVNDVDDVKVSGKKDIEEEARVEQKKTGVVPDDDDDDDDDDD